TLLCIDEHAGVEDARGVESGLGGGERAPEDFGTLLVVPAAMIAAHSVVVCDRATETNDGISGGALDLVPLFELTSLFAGGHDRVVGRRTIGVQMRESTRHLSGAADALHGVARGGHHTGVELGEAVPGDGALERLADHPHAHQDVT